MPTEDVSISLSVSTVKTLHELCSLQHDEVLHHDRSSPQCQCGAQCMPSDFSQTARLHANSHVSSLFLWADNFSQTRQLCAGPVQQLFDARRS